LATEAETLTKGERTRLHLLEVAERVFGEKGYHDASVSEITSEAGVANGTFYVYFPSKHDLLVELVRTRGHEMRAALAMATDGLESWAEIERAGATAFFDWVRRRPHVYRVVRTVQFAEPEVYREWYDTLIDGYSRGLRRAMDDGEIVKGHAEALAYCVGAVYDWAGQRWLLWEEGKPIPEDVMETILGFVLRGLGLSDRGER
jgi:AcrR family transcriptional regulator